MADVDVVVFVAIQSGPQGGPPALNPSRVGLPVSLCFKQLMHKMNISLES